jgi:hypothetical protein
MRLKKCYFSSWNECHFSWCFSHSTISLLYKSSVIPIIMFNCSVWASAIVKKRVVASLKAAQRPFALAIGHLFKSTSTDAALVLTQLTQDNENAMLQGFWWISSGTNVRSCKQIKTSLFGWRCGYSSGLPSITVKIQNLVSFFSYHHYGFVGGLDSSTHNFKFNNIINFRFRLLMTSNKLALKTSI